MIHRSQTTNILISYVVGTSS